jgi:NADPH-dependent 2,4-dienoyl-CoA reductase/sulfur reductase-like enzyme
MPSHRPTPVRATAGWFPALLVLLGLPLLQGCVAVAAAAVVGAGVVQYHRNEAEQDFPIDLQGTWQATLEGLRVLEIIPESSELSRTEGVIRAGNVTIRVERHSQGFTRVRIRVGTFHTTDHQRRADILLQEIAGAIEVQDELRAWAEKSAPEPRSKRR